ncbi:MAG TPA: ankyrin repeat domain-containing protein [Pyrinomonadaceae bacterium]|jgi:hypothetical protein|nr:ankyrin repeat domain-containing protein [Pyrinomonadaceae bacterium]
MALPRKLIAVPNAATRELWRIAESGEMDDVEAVLSRADVNARNEHGMTALMRAAYHGRVRLVRVLLEHGADPNVTRNDNFTALSLAAFFGHAEVVDILMQHGAKTDVATRFGTSPQIWAKARSYGDVARSLQTHQDQPKKSVPSVSSVVRSEPEPEPEPEPERQAEQIVTRTLKDPPEIWDLVHEAPRDFNATSAFMARLGRLNGALTITIAGLLLIGAGAAAAFYFRNKLPALLSSAPAPAAPAAKPTTAPAAATAPPAATAPTIPAAVVNPTSDATTNLTTEAPVVAVDPAGIVPTTSIGRRSRAFARPRATANGVDTQPANAETAVAPPAITPPAIATPKPEPRASAEGDTKKPTTPVNSQMITPPRAAQPKAKVIQWP